MNIIQYILLLIITFILCKLFVFCGYSTEDFGVYWLETSVGATFFYLIIDAIKKGWLSK